ncbi:MAG: hypothetical protein EOS27_14040 [Mesorhizobium sp.]|nr:MAG: hypothetical protein EOS27_14040 [Mesorhizobium sp.]
MPSNKLPRADKLTFTGFEDRIATITLSGTDPDGTVTAYILNTLPSNGTLYLDSAHTILASLSTVYATNTFYFLPSPEFSGSVSFTYGVRDNSGGISSPASATINVAPVNDAPIIDLNGPAAGASAVTTYAVSGPAKLIAPAATVTDIDSAKFSNGSLKVSITQNKSASDQLKIVTDATVTISNGAVFVSGVKVGTVTSTGVNGSDLVLSLVNGATPAAMTTLIEHIAYSSSSASPSTLARTVAFTLVDGGGTAHGGSDTGIATATVNLDHLPVGSVTVSGTATEDHVLTASNTLADGDGLGPVGYQWQRDAGSGFVDINGATGSSYTLGDADVGANVRVVASYTDGHGTPESVSSAATAAVANVNDAPTGSVTVIGSTEVDQTLTASNTLDDADGMGTVSYQWQRDAGTGFYDIAEATNAAYTLGDDDVGAAVRVVATYADGHGTAESVASAPTDDIIGAVTVIPLTEPVSGDKGWSSAAWGPAGQLVLYSTSTLTSDDTDGGSVHPDLYSVNLTTGAKTLLTGSVPGGADGDSYVAVWNPDGTFWSPDGNTLIIQSYSSLTSDDTDGGSALPDLYSVNLTTGAKTLLTGSVPGGAEGYSYVDNNWGGLAPSPDGHKLIIQSTSALTSDDTDGGNDSDLYLVDPLTGAKSLLTGSVPGGTEGYSYLRGWSADGNTLIILSTSALTSDDTDGNNDLYSMNLTTGEKTLLTGSIPGGAEGYSQVANPGWSPDGSIIINSSSTLTSDDTDGGNGSDLYSMNLTTGAKTLLTDSILGGIEGDSGVAYNGAFNGWSPDGHKLIIQSSSALTSDDTDGGDHDLYSVNLMTGEKTLLTGSVSGGAEGYSSVADSGWSPDGNTLIIASTSTLASDDTDGGSALPDLYSVNLTTGAKTLLTGSVPGGTESYSSVAYNGWSPDGNTLIIQSYSSLTSDDTDGGAWDLYAVNLANGQKTLLSSSIPDGSSGSAWGAGWSPDGSHFLFAAGVQASGSQFIDYDAFVFNAATGETMALTEPTPGGFAGATDFVYDPADHWNPKWSADGKSFEIVTTSSLTEADTDDGGLDIYAINIATGSKTLIDLGLAHSDAIHAGWGEAAPDGSGVLVGTSGSGPVDYYWLV